MRLRIILFAVLVTAATNDCLAQRAQLAIKGRRPKKGASSKSEALRKLPRKREMSELPTYVSALDEYLASKRSVAQSAQVFGADRLRPLVSISALIRTIRPLNSPDEKSANILPRRPSSEDILAGYFPSYSIPEGVKLNETVPNRWRIGFPGWQRYDNRKLDAIYAKENWWDPFNRNQFKGDYPIFGRSLFFNFTGSSQTLLEARRIPVPSVQSAARAGDFGFFGQGDQFALRQSFRLSFDLFKGSAAFKPVDYELRITPEFNINYLAARENGLTRIDVRQGTRRTDTNISLQEAFLEKRLFTNSTRSLRKAKDGDDTGSAYYDFTSLRLGIQRFTSDFRGFVFSDEQPGARLFGTFRNNIFQYNFAYFNMLEKDTNSGLNRWRQRNQSVMAANVYWSDAFTKGYTLNFSLLYNNDQPTFHLDKNGFLVRPAPIGFPVPHKVRAGYAGISGDGHIGRININHTFYQAFGRDDLHPLPALKQPQHINAQLAAVELAYESDWKTYRLSAFYTSGDKNLNDGRARGFDAIVPNQQFAGGGFLGSANLADRGLINNAFEGGGTNFLNRQAIPLTGTGVLLFGPNSLIPNLRAGPFQGQSNFINPGIFLINAGFDAKITPKLRGTINTNYARFMYTEVLQALLFQSSIRHGIGVDTGFGLQYRPALNDNIVVNGGFGVLVPQSGFENIYNGRVLYSGFVNVRFVF